LKASALALLRLRRAALSRQDLQAKRARILRACRQKELIGLPAACCRRLLSVYGERCPPLAPAMASQEDLRAKRLLFFDKQPIEGGDKKKALTEALDDDLISTAAPSTCAESLPSVEGAAVAEAQRRALYEKRVAKQKRGNTGNDPDTVPEEYNPEFDSDPEGAAMKSNALESRSSKMTAWSRGPAWRKKKEERAAKHREKMGIVSVTSDEVRAANAAKALYVRPPDKPEPDSGNKPPPPTTPPPLGPQADREAVPARLAGSVASAVHAEAVAEADRLGRVDKEELRQFFFRGLAGGEDDQHRPNKWIVLRAGEAFCELCGKWALPEHIASSAHRMRLEEDAIGQFLAGNANSTRRFDGAGLRGAVSQAAMLRYWGEHLQGFPVAAAAMFAKKQHIKFKKQMIREEDVRGFNLAVVSYTGQGTYGANNKFFDWADLPNVIPETDDPSRWEAPALPTLPARFTLRHLLYPRPDQRNLFVRVQKIGAARHCLVTAGGRSRRSP
jgi:hypothetical protein